MNYIADLIAKLDRINSAFIGSFFSILLDSDDKEVIQHISSIINSNKLVNKLSDKEFVNTPLLAHKPSRKSCYLFHVSIFNWCHII